MGANGAWDAAGALVRIWSGSTVVRAVGFGAPIRLTVGIALAPMHDPYLDSLTLLKVFEAAGDSPIQGVRRGEHGRGKDDRCEERENRRNARDLSVIGRLPGEAPKLDSRASHARLAPSWAFRDTSYAAVGTQHTREC